MPRYRDQRTVSVDIASTVLLGPNPLRVGVLLLPPSVNRELYTTGSSVANDSDTNTTGVKLTYTAPAGRRAVVLSAGVRINTGTPTLQLRATIGGTTVILDQTTASTIDTLLLHLAAGDSVDWRVDVAGGAASTADFYISATEQQSQDRYSVSLGGPATLDQGITMHPGGAPVLLEHAEWG